MAAPPLADKAALLLDDAVRTCEVLHGGDLSDVLRIRLASGRTVIVKSGPYPAHEGRMLRAMADAGAVAPLPLAADDEALVLEDLGPAAPPTDRAWSALGATLRALHGAARERYGWDEDYAFGPLRIHNGWSNDWADFWIERRLMADRDTLPSDIARRLERLAVRIADLLPPAPPPALLHGDLWSGNVHFTADGTAGLIDPASYYGDAEVDLAMLTLFATPPTSFSEAYGDLRDGWRQRRSVYQLWPALVHLRLFGASYRGLVERLIAQVES